MEAAFQNTGMRTIQIPKVEANQITMTGTIWTKASVLSVAKLALRDVNPIHMPNQHKAIRFAAAVRLTRSFRSRRCDFDTVESGVAQFDTREWSTCRSKPTYPADQ